MHAAATAAEFSPTDIPRRHVCMGMCTRCPFAKKNVKSTAASESTGCRSSPSPAGQG